MAVQLVGVLRQAGAGRVGGRCVERAAQLAQRPRHLGFGQVGAGADGDVDALARHVRQPVAHLQLHPQLGVLRAQCVQAGQQQVLRDHGAGRHAHQAARLARLLREVGLQPVECAGDALAVFKKDLAFGAEREPVGGAVDQAGAAGLLDPAQRARDLAHRHVALARRRRQAAQRGHAGEQLEVVEGERVHAAMVVRVGAQGLARIAKPF